MKVSVLKDICIGCGTCVALAEGTFEMNAEGKSQVKNEKGSPRSEAGNTDEEIMNAAKACPVEAIEVHDDAGSKLWPNKQV